MQIKSGIRRHKIEYSRKRNKCPCCTRLNCREELLRRIEVSEAQQELLHSSNGRAVALQATDGSSILS